MRELFDAGPEIVREVIRRAIKDKNDKMLLAVFERLVPPAPALDPMSEKAETGLREWTVAEIKAQAGIQ